MKLRLWGERTSAGINLTSVETGSVVAVVKGGHENAEQITRAVNTHDDLVAFYKAHREMIVECDEDSGELIDRLDKALRIE